MRMNGLLRMLTTGACTCALAMAQEAEQTPPPAAEEAPLLQQEEPTAAQKRAAEKALQDAQEPDEHVVSQSRMFSVSGGDSLRMGAIATKADEIKGHVNKLLGMEADWKYAISIRLLGSSTDAPRPNPIRTRISIIGHEPNLQIRIYPGGGIDVDKLSNAIITMLLYERALRDVRADALPESINLPMWLVTGIQQAVLWKTGRADRRLYRNLFERAEMLSPEEIVSTENAWNLDASSRQVYEVSCGVLMMSLINRPGGLVQLRELVADAIMAEGSPKEIIAAHFYELGVDANMLNKWWALELAALSLPRATEALTPMETEEQLNEALTVMFYDEESGTPFPVNADDVYTLSAMPEWRKQMRPCVERLMELSHRCFPGYRAIITEYCRAIGELLNGASPDAVQDILLPLRELRSAYVATSIRGRDYLDWYEITHLGNANKGGFQNYLDAMRLLRRESPGPDTHISRYLEDIEALHTIKAGDALKDVLPSSKKKAKTSK